MSPLGRRKTDQHSLTQWSSFLIVTFAALSLLVHFAQPSFNPIDVALSYYMNGRLGSFLYAGLTALGAGSLLLAAATYRKLGDRAPLGGLVMLAIWGLGCVVGGIFPPDAFGQWDRPPSLSGMLHGAAAIMAFIAFPFAALSLSRAYVSDTRGRRPLARYIAILSAALTVLLFITFVPALRNRPPWALGFVERITLGSYVWWLLLANKAAGQGEKLLSSGGSEQNPVKNRFESF